jgi:8-oxo-dGTP pyrophosphatase MutT (NUDIX family)
VSDAHPLLDDVVRTLSSWQPPDAGQSALRDDYLAHVAAHPDGIWRDGPSAHLTASCFVLDPTGERTLLTLHGKGRFWVQFGGHLEPGDTTLAGTALREGAEESGVALRLVGGDVPVLVDLNRHALPSAFGRCSEHLDVAFVAVAEAGSVPTVSDESHDVAWWPVDALPAGAVRDLPVRLPSAVRALRRAHP